MAAKKKGRKAKKAAKKARKAARKVAKRAAQAAKLKKKKVAPKAAPAGKPARKKAAPRTSGPKRATSPRKPAFQARQQPESLRLRSAGPSFTVSDLQKSLAFYRDVLGFTVEESWEKDGALHGVELVAGSVSFWLGQDDWQKGRDRVKGQGFRMYCGTAQDIDALARRIRERGGTLAEEPKDEPWGGRDFAVVDPDGFKITIATGL
jgi:catechol 2,3-dioxygenase-like lactoylglutathione lyase family enzyme